MTLRHASFFTGVGGVDLGYERAGMVTVSQCEVDPYASAVLAERYPGVINLGDITKVVPNDVPEAEVWSGGFPCQDLSQAGKRAGFAAGTRSSLAFTFIDLLAARKPRWVMLENVTGLFSSNNGADFARLLSEMANCGYRSISWRVFDARHFGVAQRRRRVFIVASLSPDGAQQVLFECQSGCGHIAAGSQAGENSAASAAGSADVIGTLIAGLANRTGTTQDQLYVGYGDRVAGALQARFGKGVNSTVDEPLIISTAPDPDRMRSADGVAKGVHHSAKLEGQENPDTVRAGNFELYDMPADGVAPSLNRSRAHDTLTYDTAAPLVGYNTRADDKTGNFSLTQSDWANTIGALWPGDTTHRSQTIVAPAENVLSFPSRFGGQAKVTEDIAQPFAHNAGAPAVFRDSTAQQIAEDSDHLPEGLDGHRYRCCGNGVVAPVAEWIGRRIVAVDAATDWGNV